MGSNRFGDALALAGGAGLAFFYRFANPLTEGPLLRVLIYLGLLVLPFGIWRAARVVVKRDYETLAVMVPVLSGPLALLLGDELRRAGVERWVSLGIVSFVLLAGLALGVLARRLERRRATRGPTGTRPLA